MRYYFTFLILLNVLFDATAQDICEKGGGGIFFPIFADEYNWSTILRAILYFVGLIWTFLGVGIIADVFMGAIEVITSKESITETKTGAKVPVKVWNATVANLTLMALGSSAPEILLNVIEIMGDNYFAGELGPSTIVGSAAFNLLIIMAVCVSAVVPGGRKIDGLDVYACTAVFSVFAYVWLVVILKLNSPDVVDVWEALVTFFFFPLLVWLSYALDTGLIGIPGRIKAAAHITMIGTSRFHPGEIEQYLQQLEKKHGVLPAEQREQLMISALQAKSKPSRAQYRMMATRNMTGGKKMAIQKPTEAKAVEMTSISNETVKPPQVINFKASAYSVLENAGKIVAVVTRDSGDGTVQVDYSTEGVTANAGEDFIETSGVITFAPGETEKTIEVVIVDDDEPEEDEMFLIKLANPRPNAKLGSEGMTIVTIIDDDDPGLLGFKDEDTHCTAQESDGTAHIFVSRFKGSSGVLTVDYTTENITAIGGDAENGDYTNTSGTLTFNPEEMRHEIIVPLHDRKQYDKAETFKVVLSNVTGPNEKAALSDYHNCIVTIVHNVETRAMIDKVTAVLNVNADKYSVATSSWAEQFQNAFTVGDDTGVDGLVDAEPPTMSDYILHYCSLPWKLVFALVPPTDYAGGWLCFFIALIFIGGVTAMIADLANLFGCVIGLENEITAITLVALGTSLPDTFASKTAAINDDNADACIGNVTGSNSVNVFLGLGLPWSMAALYWKINGRNEDWVKRYGADDDAYTGDDDLNSIEIYKKYDSFPGFVVPSGSLGFSVIIFTACALLALLILSMRRQVYGCELGGPATPAYITTGFFIFLWFFYVGMSILQIKGVVDPGF